MLLSLLQVTGRTALELGTLHDMLATMPVSYCRRAAIRLWWQCRGHCMGCLLLGPVDPSLGPLQP